MDISAGLSSDDRLEGLPEIEREEILAARAEEMQKYKDSMALNAMYKMTGAGGADAGEDTDGEGTSRKRRMLVRGLVRAGADTQANTRA